MSVKQIITDYLSQATRNRLVFCHDLIEDLSFINVGKVLAEKLMKENLRSSMVGYVAEDVLNDILSSPKDDVDIGSYVAIENIGVLFEPELELNLEATLDNASKDKVVIIHSEGFIKADRFYLLQEGDTSFIDLHGLSYIEIY